jgi:hypothetical protein
LLERAKELGLPQENLEDMRTFTPGAGGPRPMWLAAAVVLVVAGAGLWLARVSRKRRARALVAQG